MARLVVLRIVGSLSLVLALAVTPGCGGSTEIVADAGTDAAPAPDAGSLVPDAGPDQPDARDFCDPYVLAPAGDDPCELALPEGFLPLRMFYDAGDDSVALESLPDATYCDGIAGFYVDDEAAPTIATLCPASCAALPDPAPAIAATACGI